MNEEAKRCINGANACIYMLSQITGCTKREEATYDETTFDIISWIRARRLKWVGHILRLKDERLLKQTLRVIFDNRQDGDLLMDIEEDDWTRLQMQARDREGWRDKVYVMKVAARRKTAPLPAVKTREKNTTATTHIRTRFTFKSPTMQNNSKTSKTKQKKQSNATAREEAYAVQIQKADDYQTTQNCFDPRPKRRSQARSINPWPTWEQAKREVFSSSYSSQEDSDMTLSSTSKPAPVLSNNLLNHRSNYTRSPDNSNNSATHNPMST